MKRKNKLILLGSIILLILIALLFNKSFFRGNYRLANKKYLDLPYFLYFDKSYGEYKVNFKTIRRSKTLNKYFDNYLSDLDTCYEGRYYYDKLKNITIKNIDVKRVKKHREVFMEYSVGNLCDSEYMLEQDYFDSLELATFNKIILNKYKIKKGTIVTKNKEINYQDLKVIFKNLSKFKDATTNEDIPFNITNNLYTVEAYYYIDSNYYAMYIFNQDSDICVKVIDKYNHPKHYRFEVINGNMFLKNIYN